MAKRVTIKSIATDLGISHMTVSRALSDNPNVHKDTRDIVRKRAQELGYVRSAAARAMRGDHSPIVGLLVPNITNDFYAHFANKMAETCELHSLQLIIHLTKDDYEAERLAVNRLREIQARAVAMVPAPTPGTTRTADSPGLDVVQLIRQRNIDKGAPAVLVDDIQALRDAVAHLHRQGHDRIAYFGAPEALSSGRGRLAAYRQGLADVGLREDSSLVFTAPPSLEMGEESAHRAINETNATAILCGGFEISNGALKACMELDALNKRVSFVGYGDPDFYSWIDGGLTTIQVPVDELAAKTVELIMDSDAMEREELHQFTARFVPRSNSSRRLPSQ